MSKFQDHPVVQKNKNTMEKSSSSSSAESVEINEDPSSTVKMYAEIPKKEGDGDTKKKIGIRQFRSLIKLNS